MVQQSWRGLAELIGLGYRALEDAYMMARYFVKEYTREDAEDMIKLVEEVVNIVSRAIGDEQ